MPLVSWRCVLCSKHESVSLRTMYSRSVLPQSTTKRSNIWPWVEYQQFQRSVCLCYGICFTTMNTFYSCCACLVAVCALVLNLNVYLGFTTIARRIDGKIATLCFRQCTAMATQRYVFGLDDEKSRDAFLLRGYCLVAANDGLFLAL